MTEDRERHPCPAEEEELRAGAAWWAGRDSKGPGEGGEGSRGPIVTLQGGVCRECSVKHMSRQSTGLEGLHLDPEQYS